MSQTTLDGVSTEFLYDGTNLVAEYDDSDNLLRRYVHGPGMDEPLVWYEGSTTSNKTWLYSDHMGSVIGTANSAGTSTAIHSYGPYGEPNVTTGVRFRYTGQQLIGGLNLYYYKARFYSPALGRFLQTDPIGTADDLNLYAYVGNNPINYYDPSGLSRAETDMLAGGVAQKGGFAGSVAGAVDSFQDYLVEKNCFACGLLYASTEAVHEVFVSDGLKSVDSLRNGDYSDAALAATLSFVKPAKIVPESLQKQALDLIPLNGNRNRATIRSPSQQLEVDLSGRAHGGIPTPHTRVSPRNTMAPNQPAYNTRSSPIQPATQQDIRTVRRYLERQ